MKAIQLIIAAVMPFSGWAVLAADHPNIVVIFTDDWGHADLGVHQQLADVKTPHLDALSSQGVLFTDAYITAPQCSPSRAGLDDGTISAAIRI